MREEVLVGIAQWLPVPGRPAENLATAIALVAELARRGADLVVLPELWPSGYDVTTLRQDVAAAAEPLEGPRTRALAECAGDLGIWLAAGSVPEAAGRAGREPDDTGPDDTGPDDAGPDDTGPDDAGPDGASGARIYNTALLFDRQGRLRARHRKAHLYAPTGEDKIFAAGGRLTTCRTDELGVVGLTVCFDGDFPETGRALRDAGATLVIQPSAYESAAADWWDRLYPAIALSNGQWWVMANQCGTNPSGTLLGRSQVISPFGSVVAAARSAVDGLTPEPELLVVEVPLRRSCQMAADANAALWQLRRPGLTVREFGAEPSDDLVVLPNREG